MQDQDEMGGAPSALAIHPAIEIAGFLAGVL
jgi:hypothetical protein